MMNRRRFLQSAGGVCLLASHRMFGAGLQPFVAIDSSFPATADSGNQGAPGTYTMTVDLSSPSGRKLKKPGLGALFGVSSIAGGTSVELLRGSIINTSASQGRIGENGSNPFSTEAVAPILRQAGSRMVCRFNDLCYGFPYAWPGYNEWISQVTNAAHTVSSSYKDVVYAIAPFNEPDVQMNSSAFNSDPLMQGADYDSRVNWLWTQTVRLIRSIDDSIPIMGPNYLNYRPWEDSYEQTRMQNFLINAIATNTVPNVMGWHSLGPSPGDVYASLTSYYRPLEAQLAVPGAPLPISIEEYGPGTGDFNGVPGTMMKHWAEFERFGIDFAGMGIYTNGGLLGNVLRYPWETHAVPNAGWHTMHWYRQMQGQYVPVSRWDTRYYQCFDGVADWNEQRRTATVIFGGSDDNANIEFDSISSLGLGRYARVRLDSAVWSVDANQQDQTVEHGGDPQIGTQNIFDKVVPIDGGSLSVPVRHLEGYNAYRLSVGPVDADERWRAQDDKTYSFLFSKKKALYDLPTKYEAEDAALKHAAVVRGSQAALASGDAYVTGISVPGAQVRFSVIVPETGIYVMTVRYSNADSVTATQNLVVNEESQGMVQYPTSYGNAQSEFQTTTKRVALGEGENSIVLTPGTGMADLDYIQILPDTHRYQAVYANVNDSIFYEFDAEIDVPDYVGGINNSDSYVEFAIDAPKVGTYRVEVHYANGTTDVSTHQVLVNGFVQASASYPPTGGWFSASDPRTSEGISRIAIELNQGVNPVRFQKGTGYAELSYLTLHLPEESADRHLFL